MKNKPPQHSNPEPIIIFGFHAVNAAIAKDPKSVSRIWIEGSRKDKRVHEILKTLKYAHVPYQLTDHDTLSKLTHANNHQGIAAELRSTNTYTELDLSEILQKESVLLLVLDGVEDPHNLGACLRSAAAAGVDAVIAPKDRAVGLTPTVRKVASGAAEIIPFIQVTNLTNTLEKLKKANVWCFGAASEAETKIYDADLTGRIAIVMGSESKGLRRLTREHCDALIRIPISEQMESLNVSVATGIILFETLRQSIARAPM